MKQETPWVYKASIFLCSQLISLFGSSTVGFVIIWYITLETSSGSFMTIAILCSFLPQVLISLFAGVWADRYNRKLLIICSDSFIALATLGLVLVFISGVQSYTLLFVVACIRSIGTGIQTPAVNALLPQIVPVEKLTRVNGINNALQSALLLLSPAFGGLLLGTVGFSYALLVDVITASMSVGIMSFLPVSKPSAPQKPLSAMEELKNGLSYAQAHPFIGKLLVFYALFFFLITPAAFLTPIMIERSFGPEIWRLTANEISWTVGSMIGGIIISLWGGYQNRFTTMALSSIGFGVTFALLGMASHFYLYLAIMLISGIFMPFFSTAETVLLQESVAPHMLGRVFSLVQIIAASAMPLGMVVFGPLGDLIQIEYILIGTGICLIFLSFYIFRCKEQAGI